MSRHADRVIHGRARYLALQTWLELWKQAVFAEVLLLSAQAAAA